MITSSAFTSILAGISTSRSDLLLWLLPAIFSISLIIGKNLSFQAGSGVIQKETLRGENYEGQIVNEHPDFENLHRRVYYPEWFFSGAFRFGKVVFVERPEDQDLFAGVRIYKSAHQTRSRCWHYRFRSILL